MQNTLHEIKTERYHGFFPLKVALFLVAAAALVTLVFWQMRIADKRAELLSLQKQIYVQELKNDAIRDTVRSLEDEEGLSQYAEKEAREGLDYARPGERVFVDAAGD